MGKTIYSENTKPNGYFVKPLMFSTFPSELRNRARGEDSEVINWQATGDHQFYRTRPSGPKPCASAANFYHAGEEIRGVQQTEFELLGFAKNH